MEIGATAMLPWDDAAAARSALRTRLRDVVERREIPESALDGATMVVAGPVTVTDAGGRTWFQWVATLRMPSAAAAAPLPSDPTAVEDPPAPGGPAARPTVDDLRLLRHRVG
ncbi:hypothetical protein [Blastococcus sp. KM273129]|uniref:hypothetical protein n=1 Tax=Blastococcus sp. KM273129 TaxID=2570315 RepID=UPI001F190BD9|nr:hypothetical protein [Blastococcus sp. KM273129]MCF6735615.1 hypothetical protein [Blastococcus sp. KM273129]